MAERNGAAEGGAERSDEEHEPGERSHVAS
jgi:hypothetical protein